MLSTLGTYFIIHRQIYERPLGVIVIAGFCLARIYQRQILKFYLCRCDYADMKCPAMRLPFLVDWMTLKSFFFGPKDMKVMFGNYRLTRPPTVQFIKTVSFQIYLLF